MKRPWFQCKPADETFLDAAPTRLVGVFEVARPAADVWSELTADRPLWWCRILDDVSWTSARPLGVGATRTVKSLKGASVFHEHFFRWEDGRRKSFYVLESSAPLFRRFAEDYLVEPASDNSCRFTWTIAWEPQPAARFTNPVNKRILGTLHTDTRKHYGAS
ncbi:MAG: hypothetical protein QOJ29_4912 [Thermoleophilaceae bacterium]|nr:hypothetical protein [Thermoleophilaceae bacterium]